MSARSTFSSQIVQRPGFSLLQSSCVMYGTEFLLLHGFCFALYKLYRRLLPVWHTLFYLILTDVSLDWILLDVFSLDFFSACLFTLIALFDVCLYNPT